MRARWILLLAMILLLACQGGTKDRDDAERFVGVYTYNDGAHSFTPCGSDDVYPLIPGEQLDELLAYQRAPGGPVVLEILAHRSVGPASEGEGTDEYLEVDRVIGEDTCQ